MIVPRVALTLAVYPAFMFLVNEKSLWSLLAVSALLNLLSTVSAATAVGRQSPKSSRTGCAARGMAVSYAISVCVFGGTTQFVIAWLIGATGDPLSPAYYVI